MVLHHMNFKGKVSHCEFSPCGRSFAVCVGKLVQIWATPTMLKEFAPFRLLRTYGGMYDEATCLAWSPDSRWIIVGSKDLTARIYSANHMEGYVPPTLAGHREQLCHVTFAGGWRRRGLHGEQGRRTVRVAACGRGRRRDGRHGAARG